MPGRTERGKLGLLPAHRPSGREELDVLRVRAGPPSFDERHAVLVEHPGHAELVGERQRDVLALRSVAQGRVVEDDRGGCGGGGGGGGGGPAPPPPAPPPPGGPPRGPPPRGRPGGGGGRAAPAGCGGPR